MCLLYFHVFVKGSTDGRMKQRMEWTSIYYGRNAFCGGILVSTAMVQRSNTISKAAEYSLDLTLVIP